MSERRDGFGLAAIAVIPIACCIGLPLLAAAGIGVAVLVGGVAAGAVAVIAAAVLLVRRTRRRETPSRRF
jgi:hypothetical protein